MDGIDHVMEDKDQEGSWDDGEEEGDTDGEDEGEEEETSSPSVHGDNPAKIEERRLSKKNPNAGTHI